MVYKPVILHVGIDLKFLTDLTAAVAAAAHLPIEIHLTAVGVVSDSAVCSVASLPPSVPPSFTRVFQNQRRQLNCAARARST